MKLPWLDTAVNRGECQLFDRAREQRDAQAQQVNALRTALRLANLRYKGGLANYLDVLIAQRNLFEAEWSFTATHRLHLVSIVQLYKALGGGWSPEGAPMHTMG